MLNVCISMAFCIISTYANGESKTWPWLSWFQAHTPWSTHSLVQAPIHLGLEIGEVDETVTINNLSDS